MFRHSLEHTADPVQALRAAAGALSPGGVVLITVPNFGGWQARRFRGRWYRFDSVPALFGRCVFPGGLGFRVASGLCALTLAVTAGLDWAAGAGDLLHVVAERPG